MKIIITGTTGMIGEGVLIECLSDSRITEILSVSRKPTGKSHPKLKEYIFEDFLSIREDDPRLKRYDACFFCAGVSSLGVKQRDYERITYDNTLHFAKALDPNPRLSFIYVSGGGTDSTEKGRLHWARIKGKTENELMRLPFRQAFGFRIGMVKPAKGQLHTLKIYNYLSWILPVISKLFPSISNTMQEVTNAMIYVSTYGFERNLIFVNDIHQMSKKQ